MKIAVILPAAGLGKRFASAQAADNRPATSKIELDLLGKPVFLRAIELFLQRPGVGQVIVAVNPDAVDDFKFRWAERLAFLDVTIVAGGRTERWETVLKAMAKVDADATHVAVHDAARPMTSSTLIDRVFEAAAHYPAVIPGLPVSATLKRVADAAPRPEDRDPLDAILGDAGKTRVPVRRVVATVDRSALVEVQTPQVFEIGLLRRAYAPLEAEGAGSTGPAGSKITDDAGLVEALGVDVHVVEGESTNLKITRPDDMKLAEAFLRMTEGPGAAASARKRLFGDADEDE